MISLMWLSGCPDWFEIFTGCGLHNILQNIFTTMTSDRNIMHISWGLTSQSTIFQSCPDRATVSLILPVLLRSKVFSRTQHGRGRFWTPNLSLPLSHHAPNLNLWTLMKELLLFYGNFDIQHNHILWVWCLNCNFLFQFHSKSPLQQFSLGS